LKIENDEVALVHRAAQVVGVEPLAELGAEAVLAQERDDARRVRAGFAGRA
jgi:hypothetical protein